MASIQLTINVPQPDVVLNDFDVIRVKRSITVEGGPYSLITANTATSAFLAAPNAGPYAVVGLTLSFLIDQQTQFDHVFTGTDPLTAAQVVDQLNTLVGDTVAVDNGGTLELNGIITGTESKVEIVANGAAAVFGWAAGDRDIGEEPHVTVQTGVTLYNFVDNDGEAGYFYTVQYYNTVNGLASNDSDPFQGAPGTLVDPTDLSSGSVDLVDASGRAVPNQEISFYSVHEPLQVGAFQVALNRAPITIETDNAGHAEVNLVRGLRVKVVFEGTSIIREFTVPDTATFDLLQILGDAEDPYSISQPNFPFAIRRTT
jgi:hypothetical protein